VAMELRIQRAAELVGVTPRALRLYEKKGLLPPAERTFSNYRLYTGWDIAQLLRIKRLSALGFSLTQISRVLSQTVSPDESRRALAELDAELAREVDEMQEKRRAIAQLLAGDVPLDVRHELAAVLKRIWDLFPSSEDEVERDKLRLEVIMGVGTDSDRRRLAQLADIRVDMEGSPEAEALRDADARFAALGPESSNEEIESLIQAYSDVLVVVYGKLADKLSSEVIRQANADLYNEEQARVMTEVWATLEMRFSSAGQ